MDDVTLTLNLLRLLATVPGWTWTPDGPAPQGSALSLFYGAIPDKPDRAIGVRVYGAPPDDPNTDIIRRAQLRIRGAQHDRADADAIASIALHVMTGTVRRFGISEIERTSFTPLGTDKNGREERTENYQTIIDNPEASS